MQKKYFIKAIIFISVVFLSVSCANNDPLTESELSTAQINFTKNNAPFQLTKIESGIDKFYVYGYYTANLLFQDYVANGNPPKSDWMFNQEVSHYGNGEYGYNPVKYWPAKEDDKITFMGYTYSPNTLVTPVSPDPITKLGEPKFKYTTKTDDPTGDLLVSQPAYNLTRKSGSVKLFMQHVLSKVRFNIKSTSVNVKIKSIQLKNTLTEAEFTAHGRVWSKLENRLDLKKYLIPESEQLLTNAFKLLSSYYIVLPQDILNSTPKPTFALVFDDNGVEKTLEFVPSKNWEIYTSYMYNITYSAGELEVLTDIDPWEIKEVEDEITANQYLNVSTRELDLAHSHHFYYNSSFPTTSVHQLASYPDKSVFTLSDYFDVSYIGNKIRLQGKSGTDFSADLFTIYVQGHDLHGHVIVKLPINVRTESEGGIEVDGTFWAPGNIIYHDGHLEIAPNANYTGLYFRWGSLIGLAGNNAKSFQFIPEKTVGFRPTEFNGTISKWNEVPYERTMASVAHDDAFKERYDNKLGFDAVNALGDPCRYMSHQQGWTKGKWRMPTKAEYDAIVFHRKIRKINGIWGIADESHEHTSATTGTLAVEAGWFIKTDMTDDTISPDDEFNSVKPPKGWVFYPASGQRSGYTGALSEYSTLGYYWTATTVSWDAAYRFQFSKTDTGDNQGSFNDVASGFLDAYPIRCVRDTSK